MNYCQLCGVRDANGIRHFDRCSHRVCSSCCAGQKSAKGGSCGCCAFADNVCEFEQLVILLPRPRHQEAKEVVLRHGDRPKCVFHDAVVKKIRVADPYAPYRMLARHHIPPIGSSDIAQSFRLRAGQLAALEMDAWASNFRVARYAHPSKKAACYIVLDSTETVYTVSFAGVRSRVFDMDAWANPMRRIMGALAGEFVRSGVKTSWLAVSCDAVSYTDWKLAFNEELLNNESDTLATSRTAPPISSPTRSGDGPQTDPPSSSPHQAPRIPCRQRACVCQSRGPTARGA